MYSWLSRFSQYWYLAIILCFLFFWTQWFRLPAIQPIDLDEVAWVQDAEVYEWRIEKNWDRFTWSPDRSFVWTAPDFRLFDQPHFVKYIFGFFLTMDRVTPWSDSVAQEKNYRQFVEQTVSGRYFLSDPGST